ncbi:hypothetical protein BDR05DRAFT_733247 [Suillus weaverae]|nr:hypothetical protein BDR05DRAFT_733247 [Suillus weaverae]
MSLVKNYVCAAQADCNKTFTKYTDLKKHEAAHSSRSVVILYVIQVTDIRSWSVPTNVAFPGVTLRHCQNLVSKSIPTSSEYSFVTVDDST